MLVIQYKKKLNNLNIFQTKDPNKNLTLFLAIKVYFANAEDFNQFICFI